MMIYRLISLSQVLARIQGLILSFIDMEDVWWHHLLRV